MQSNKVVSMTEAISAIKDGAHVALGGSRFHRHPMAAVHEIIRKGIKNLTIFGVENTIDFDLLIAAGCVKKAHVSFTDSTVFGDLRNISRAFQNGNIDIKSHTAEEVKERFRAGALGLSFIPFNVTAHSKLITKDNHTKEIVCPFSDKRYIALKAFSPDVAIIHAHRADRYGNVQMDLRKTTDIETELFIARSARFVIVTVEQIVSDEAVQEEPYLTFIPGEIVNYVIETPFGAHPTSCDYLYDSDSLHLQYYLDRTKTVEAAERYIDEYILSTADWYGYLNKIGLERLLTLSHFKRQQSI